VIAMHPVNGQNAHHRAAREPQEELRTDDDRKPFVGAARKEVQP
jgi:hypothetical protein